LTAQVLYAGEPDEWPDYQAELAAAFQRVGVDVSLRNAVGDAADIDYIVYAPSSPIQDFSPFTSLKAVLSLWAGVEAFRGNKTLTKPLARMVETGMIEGMVEWVLGHVMRYHLGLDAHVFGQDGVWRNDVTPPLARQRVVGVLGLGALGLAVAKQLRDVGFEVCGWSRTLKNERGIACFAGQAGLRDVLGKAEILVLLVPNTAETENLLNAETLALLPIGARIINPGRGPLIDDDALLAALDSGHISHATLDVFRDEPLPVNHVYWTHPKVTVTPHIASATRVFTACETIAENVRRGEAGEPFLHLVDRARGY